MPALCGNCALVLSSVNRFTFALKKLNSRFPLSSATVTFTTERLFLVLNAETDLIYPKTVVLSPSFKFLISVLEE